MISFEVYSELKNGKKIQVLSSTCLENRLVNRMPILNRLVGGYSSKRHQLLRSSSEKSFDKKKQFTGMIGYVMAVACTLLKAPFGKCYSKHALYQGTVKALCLNDSLRELIILSSLILTMIESISGARALNDPDEN